MKKSICLGLLIGLLLAPTISLFSKNPIIEIASNPKEQSENELFFYRVVKNQMLNVVYEDIFGESLGTTVKWFQIFADDDLLNFTSNDYLILENNQSGGFEIFDEDFSFLSLAPDVQQNYSLMNSYGNWVKSRSRGFNKIYYSTDKGKKYTVTYKFSLGGKHIIQDEKGYQITLNTKINGNVDISDNEGRKMFMKYDRSGVYRLLDGSTTKMSLMVQSLQHYSLSDERGLVMSLVKRGRYNDIFIKTADGHEMLIENRFIKPVTTPDTTEKKEDKK